MTTYSKFNMVYRLQKWMDSVAGQTFLNYAYSWGAAIVILGTLFKLTHLPAANFFLFLGMGTEVFVFFISAFDRPFDKTADGMNLSTEGRRPANRQYDEAEEFEVPIDNTGGERYSPSSLEEVRQQLGRKIEQADALSHMLPKDALASDINDTLNALREVYRESLLKSSQLLTDIDEGKKQFKLFVAYVSEINGVLSKLKEAFLVQKSE